MYAGDELYDDEVTSGPVEGPVPTSIQNAWNERALDALRSIEDPDEVPRCVDCGVEVDGLGPPICRECADVED